MTAAALMLALLQGQATCKTYLVANPAPGLLVKGKNVVVELPPIGPDLAWTEAVPSWNVDRSEKAQITVEARVVYPDRATKYYSFGTWSGSNMIGSRFSVNGQKDVDGTVLTDTLRVSRPGGKLQFRLTGQVLKDGPPPKLTRLFVNVADVSKFQRPAEPTTVRQPEGPPDAGPVVNKIPAAWGLAIDPPQFAQGDYPGGKGLCSPASVAMVIDYWSSRMGVKALAVTVPQVQSSVYDSVYEGTGNWSFNASFAGSKPGLLGYAARLNSIEELEDWIVKSVPIVCSVSWYLLHGEELKDDEEGHLVVLVGFTSTGDPVFNDPGKRGEVRKIYRRADFQRAWDYSKRTAYVITPPKFATDKDFSKVEMSSAGG